MKTIYRLLLSALMLFAVGMSFAQDLQSGYFIENYNYRYLQNPAFGNEKNFVSMPVLGNLNIGVAGNLHLNSVIYNYQGRTVLFTNPGISAAEVLGNLNDVNKLNFNMRETLLAVGFKAFHGYNSITISAIANAQASVPLSFFQLVKEGVTNKTYQISDLRAQANSYAEIALNHSHDLSNIVPGLRVGANLKFLVGVGSVQAFMNEANLVLGEDNWIVSSNADVYASIKGLQYKHKYNDDTHREYVSDVDIDDFKPQGFGMALDLGAEYAWREFKFSAAVTDLGFISFPTTMLATTDGLQTVETDAYTFNVDGDKDNSFSKEWKLLKNNLSSLYQLSDKGDVGGRTRTLATTLHFGADYEFMYYRNLHFGLLNTTQIYGPYTSTDFRLSANVRPVKCFAANANVNMGTYGFGFGWLLNVNVPGFNFFMGMDRVPSKLAKQGAPLTSNMQFNMGIDFPF